MVDKVRLDDLCVVAINKWGEDAQILQSYEEFGELIAAINQFQRGKIEIHELVSEIADAYIMLRQLVLMFECEEFLEKITEEKLVKLEKLIKKESE